MKKIVVLSLLVGLSFSATIVVKANAKTKKVVVKKGFTYEKLSAKDKKAMIGVCYPKSGAKISLSELRKVTVKYVNFSKKTKKGVLIVNKSIAKKTAKIFYELYKHNYPIQRIKTIENYGGDDETSMRANNSSAFNYREIRDTGVLSNHGKGLAIDINPLINPCICDGVVEPKTATKYVERDKKKCKGKYKKYMIDKNDFAYKVFKKYGFGWGGDYTSLKDYQHFEYVKK